MIRILIIDDHAIIRQGLQQIVAETDDITVAAEAADYSQAISLIEKPGIDVVVLDLSMPGRGGMDILKAIKAAKPNLPVLILSMHDEDQYALRLLRAGASGYIMKSGAPEELVAAIRKIVSGGTYTSTRLAERIMTSLRQDQARQPHDSLSNQELQVVVRIANGANVSDIAKAMHLSVKTVSTYRTRALEKLQLTSNADITKYAILNGLVE